jgi:hypothetical protein
MWKYIVMCLVIAFKSNVAMAANSTYLCTVLDSKIVSDTGKLVERRYKFADKEMLLFNDDGVLTHLENKWKMDIVQDGTRVNGLVAIRVYKGTASTPVSMLRIEVYEENLPFMYIFINEIMSGTCQRL